MVCGEAGGRLFVCAGTTIYELDNTGATIASHGLGTGAGDGKPVQFFGNGNQLGIVADGLFFIDNGTPPPLIPAGPIAARFQISGSVTIIGGTAVTWQSGDKFPWAAGPVSPLIGIYMTIGGQNCYVSNVSSNTALTLSTAIYAAGGTGTCYAFFKEVFIATGTIPPLTQAMVGQTVQIAGVTYVVESVTSDLHMTITEPVPFSSMAITQAISTVQTNIPYSAAAGSHVTAITGAYLDGTFYVQRPAAQPVAYTDLVIDGTTNTNITSAAHPFTEESTDTTLVITGGAGFTAGTYTIQSVVFGIATLNTAVGTVGSTGGTGTAYPSDLGRQVNYSAVNDGTSWNYLDFKQKEGAADYIRGILADAEILYVRGRETLEAWQNDPNTGLPVRIPGAMQRFGGVSAWGASAINSRVYFVGGDAEGSCAAYLIDSSIPTRISTHAEEEAWKAAGLGIDCVSYTYMEDGHIFWVINFGTESWAWDETNKLWGKRMCWSGTDFSPYQTQFHTFIQEWGNAGKHLTAGGSLADGIVYESSNLFYDDNGGDIAWRRAIPYRYNGGNQIFHGRMTLECETGTAGVFTITVAAGSPTVCTKTTHGLINGNIVSFSGGTGNWAAINGLPFVVTYINANSFSIPLNSTGFGAGKGTIALAPLITRDYSDDRGKTFILPQTASLGPAGAFSQCVFWPTGGSSRGRSWRFFGVGKQKLALIDLQGEEVTGVV